MIADAGQTKREMHAWVKEGNWGTGSAKLPFDLYGQDPDDRRAWPHRHANRQTCLAIGNERSGL